MASAPPANGYGQSRQPSRRGSMEGTDLEEFSPATWSSTTTSPKAARATYTRRTWSCGSASCTLRQRELALREQEMRMRRGPPPMGPPGSRRAARRHRPARGRRPVACSTTRDDDEDYFDPASTRVHDRPRTTLT